MTKMMFLFIAICVFACLFFCVVLFYWIRDGQPKREIGMGVEDKVDTRLDRKSQAVIHLPL